MWALAWTIVSVGFAADRADVPPDGLTIEGEGFSIRVLGRGVPLFENLFEGGACRITFTGRGTQLVSQVRECPEGLRDEVVPSSKYWLFETTGDLTGVTFDAWYLIDGRGVTTHLGPSRYRVKGSELPVWTLSPSALALPQWPAGQSLPATCQVILTTAPDGAMKEVSVAEEGCPSGYGASVAAAARTWTVAPVVTNGVTVPLVFEATVRFSPPGDGAGATIDLDLPVPPEVPISVVGELPPRRRLPDVAPLFQVRHRTYADVTVYAVGAPAAPPAPVDRRCEFLLQVNSSGRTWLWPEERCPSDVHPALEASRQEWSVVAGKPGPGQVYARFRGTWELPADGGAPVLRIPEGDLVGKPTLPDNVRSYAVAEPQVRVPPKLPRGYVLADPVVCVLDVTVGVRGRVTSVMPAAVTGHAEPGGCPEELLVPAQRSAAKWRWRPAASDGEPFESHATVKVRFGGGGA
jgi:hypothetical protein